MELGATERTRTAIRQEGIMKFDRTIYRRTIGATTASYGATLLANPSALTKPAGLRPTTRNTNLARVIGARDLLSGAFLLFAPEDKGDLAVAIRVAGDASDILTFGIMCPKSTKLKAVAIAAGYGLTCSLAHSRIAQKIA